jgi:hypothetical protein
MKTLQNLLIAALGVAILVVPAHAGRLVLAPAEAQATPVDGSAVTRVAVRFDLSVVPEGAVIEMAYLEWSVGELTGEEAAVFLARAIGESWTANAELSSAPDVDSEKVAGWRIEPGGAAAEEGRVRLELTELARQWALGLRENFGVAIDTAGLDEEAADAVLGGARLVVHYGRR